MEKTKNKAIGLLAAGALIITSSTTHSALAEEQSQNSVKRTNQEAYESLDSSHLVKTQIMLSEVQGEFGWNQNVVTDNEILHKVLYQGARYLCDSQLLQSDSLVQSTKNSHTNDNGVASIEYIKISGEVEHAFSASVEEYVNKAPTKKVMGCTCSGNPADGRASANALVGGFRLAALVEDAQPQEGVNTITFTSSDGYEVSFPLSYVLQRYSIIVTSINDENAQEAIACSNQLWLGSTGARSFARDVVSIKLSTSETPPPVPTVEKTTNQPNVGVIQGEAS